MVVQTSAPTIEQGTQRVEESGLNYALTFNKSTLRALDDQQPLDGSTLNMRTPLANRLLTKTTWLFRPDENNASLP